ATYDGSANATGINLYLNGSVEASSDTDDVNFTSLRNKTSVVELGKTEGANFFDGKIAGGPLGPFFVQADLNTTPDKIKRLYNLGRRALGV
ncbi:hypothetical protein LCGC14_2898170, partial [marine sediment metagenome]